MNQTILIIAVGTLLLAIFFVFTIMGRNKEESKRNEGVKRRSEKVEEEFFEAVKNNDYEAMLGMLDKVSVDVNDKKHWTALLYAAKEGNGRIVEMLLSRGADVNHQSFTGKSAIFYALEEKKREIVKLLLDADADVNMTTEKGATPIYTAIEKRDSNSIELLLEHGAKVTVRNRNGITPLMLAAMYGDEYIVKLILEEGKKITQELRLTSGDQDDAAVQEENILSNDRAANGWTPLMFAIEKGHFRVFSLLLAEGGDPFLTTHCDFSTIVLAISGKDPRILERLIEIGVNINAQSEDGNTALHHAVLEGNAEALEILIKHKANLSILNKVKKTPYELAIERQANSLANIIDKASDFVG